MGFDPQKSAHGWRLAKCHGALALLGGSMTRRRFPIPTRHTVPRYEYAPRARRRVRRDPAALVAFFVLLLLAVAAAVGPFLATHDPLIMNASDRLQPPSAQHWLGTDLFGRDIGARLLAGAHLSLRIGGLSVLIAALPGTLLGLLAGYYGRWVDRLLGWLIDVMLAFPTILLALTIVAALGPGVRNVVLAVGISGVPSYTRLVRGQVLSLRRRPFVRAAVSVGCSDARILLRHILPNLVGTVVILATLDVGWAILNASALSFLGLGAQPPTPEWGLMLSEGRAYLREAPWIAAAPGLAIAATVLAVNVLGDSLRDALNPQLRTQ
jgi:peptide/nickel transport system permease protein